MWAQVLGCTAQAIVYGLCLWAPIAKCDGQWALILSSAVLLSLGDAGTRLVLYNDYSCLSC